MRIAVLKAVQLKLHAFWDVMPCCWAASSSSHCQGLHCLHLQGQALFPGLSDPDNEGTTCHQNDRNCNIPKRPESFMKWLIWFGNCNLCNYLWPSLESNRPHLNSLLLQTSIQCLTQLQQLPFSLNMQYTVNVSTHLQVILRAGVSDAPVYHSHRPQAPHNTICERLLEAIHTHYEQNKQNYSYSSVEFL
jgi:hypothetical protein